MLFPFQWTYYEGSSGCESGVLVVVEKGVDNGKAVVAAVVEQVHHYR